VRDTALDPIVAEKLIASLGDSLDYPRPPKKLDPDAFLSGVLLAQYEAVASDTDAYARAMLCTDTSKF